MKVIGITGGIGAGKTHVSKLINDLYHTPTYDCDSEAKRLTIESAEIRQKLTALLGEDVYDKNGLLNKQLLAQYLFSNKQNAERINAIIHPVVRHDFLRWKGEQISMSPTLLLESAILMESHFDDLCDELIIVTAPKEVRIQRACQRDKSTAEAVAQRIEAQLSDNDRLEIAYKCKGNSHIHIINNDGSPLESQLQNLIEKQ